MPASKDLSKYADVRAVLDAAIATGEDCMYRLPTAGKATSWRMRANVFMKLFREQSGVHSSPYDGIKLVINGAATHIVHITFWKVEGQLSTAAGEEVNVNPSQEDSYIEEAQRVARELGLETSNE